MYVLCTALLIGISRSIYMRIDITHARNPNKNIKNTKACESLS